MPSDPFVHLVGPGPLLGIEIHSHTRHTLGTVYPGAIEQVSQIRDHLIPKSGGAVLSYVTLFQSWGLVEQEPRVTVLFQSDAAISSN
jgi:hypothetical protein